MTISDEYKTYIQPIVLNEFQPDQIVYTSKLIGGALEVAAKFFKIDHIVDAAGKILVNELTMGNALNALTAMYSKNPSSLYDISDKNIATNPMESIIRMFTRGKWLGTYELPFFSSTYLQSNTAYNKWAAGGLSNLIGEGAAKVFQGKGISFDVPSTPTFTLGSLSETSYSSADLKTEFYLINKNDNWLERNYRFLHAFFAGTQWVQLPFGMIKGSNIYNVLVPGRFNLLWAAVGSTVSAEGKLRKNPNMFNKFGGIINSIDEDTLWPDAWKITIEIKDLTPNSFNTYINYFVNGTDSTNKSVRENAKNGTWMTDAAALGTKLGEFIAEFKKDEKK
jgi:hypothetical protein